MRRPDRRWEQFLCHLGENQSMIETQSWRPASRHVRLPRYFLRQSCGIFASGNALAIGFRNERGLANIKRIAAGEHEMQSLAVRAHPLRWLSGVAVCQTEGRESADASSAARALAAALAKNATAAMNRYVVKFNSHPFSEFTSDHLSAICALRLRHLDTHARLPIEKLLLHLSEFLRHDRDQVMLFAWIVLDVE